MNPLLRRLTAKRNKPAQMVLMVDENGHESMYAVDIDMINKMLKDATIHYHGHLSLHPSERMTHEMLVVRTAHNGHNRA